MDVSDLVDDLVSDVVVDVDVVLEWDRQLDFLVDVEVRSVLVLVLRLIGLHRHLSLSLCLGGVWQPSCYLRYLI